MFSFFENEEIHLIRIGSKFKTISKLVTLLPLKTKNFMPSWGLNIYRRNFTYFVNNKDIEIDENYKINKNLLFVVANVELDKAKTVEDKADKISQLRKAFLIPRDARFILGSLPENEIFQISAHLNKLKTDLTDIPDTSNPILFKNSLARIHKSFNDAKKEDEIKLDQANEFLREIVSSSSNVELGSPTIESHQNEMLVEIKGNYSGIDIFSSSIVSENVPFIAFVEDGKDADERENFVLTRQYFEYNFVRLLNDKYISENNENIYDKQITPSKNKPRHYIKIYNPDIDIVPDSIANCPSSEFFANSSINTLVAIIRINKHSDPVTAIVDLKTKTVEFKGNGDIALLVECLNNSLPRMEFTDLGVGKLYGYFDILNSKSEVVQNIFYLICFGNKIFSKILHIEERNYAYSERNSVINFSMNNMDVTFSIIKNRINFVSKNRETLLIFSILLKYMLRKYDEYDKSFFASLGNCVEMVENAEDENNFSTTNLDKLTDLRSNGAKLQSSYAVDCQCPFQPIIITDDEEDDWGLTNQYLLEHNGKKFICPNEKNVFPILNDKKDQKQYPCCFKSIRSKTASSNRAEYVMSKILPLGINRIGALPDEITSVFNRLLDPKYNFVRIGVGGHYNSDIEGDIDDKKDSLIHCVLYSINDADYINPETRISKVKQVRKMVENMEIEIFAQEFFDANPIGGNIRKETLENLVKESFKNDQSVQYHLHFRALEKLFKVHIFSFNNSKTPSFRNSNTVAPPIQLNSYRLEVPRCAVTCYRHFNKKYNGAVAVFAYTNSETGKRDYDSIISRGIIQNRSEIKHVAPDVSKGQIKLFDSEVANKLIDIFNIQNGSLKSIGGRLDLGKIVLKQCMYKNYTPVSQYIDMFGKLRAVRSVSKKGKNLLFITLPTAPLSGIKYQYENVIFNEIDENVGYSEIPDIQPNRTKIKIIENAKIFKITNVIVQCVFWIYTILRIKGEDFDFSNWWNRRYVNFEHFPNSFPNFSKLPKIVDFIQQDDFSKIEQECMEKLIQYYPDVFKNGKIYLPNVLSKSIRELIETIDKSTKGIEDLFDTPYEIIPEKLNGVLDTPELLGSGGNVKVFMSLEDFNFYSNLMYEECDYIYDPNHLKINETMERVDSQVGDIGDLNDKRPAFGTIKN